MTQFRRLAVYDAGTFKHILDGRELRSRDKMICMARWRDGEMARWRNNDHTKIWPTITETKQSMMKRTETKLQTLIITLAACLMATFASTEEQEPPTVTVSGVRRVFHNGQHNAFTDLTRFRDRFYLTFRSCPDGHGVSPNASVIILRSKDALEWEQVHQFNVPLRDTRDPHFLIFKDRLFVYTGTWFSGTAPARSSKDLDLNLHLGYAVSSTDGTSWSAPTMLEGTFGHYIWRAAAFGGKAYLCGRRKIGFEVGATSEPRETVSLLLESDDGLIWRKRAVFQEIAGDETAFLFEPDGHILAIGRRGRDKAQLLRSSPPYSEWRRQELDRYIGGPLVTKWGNRYVVGGRNKSSKGYKTSMCWLIKDRLHEFAELPSDGDNSYPGFVALSSTRALMSWYSSHEKTQDAKTSAGKTMTAIYLADLELKKR